MNLTESFKEEYEKFLSECLEEDFNNCNNFLEEAHKETMNSFDLLENYFDAYAKYETLSEVVTGVEPQESDAKSRETDKMISSANELFKSVLNIVKASPMENIRQDKDLEYKPEDMFFQVEKLSDMKFPQNIIFFIKQLVIWIKNLVVAFISKITNIVRRVVGLSEVNDDKENYDISLKLNKLKKIEMAKGFETVNTKSDGIVKVVKVNPDSIKDLERDFLIESVLVEDNNEKKDVDSDKNLKKKPGSYALEINISKDMEELNQLVSHFFNIFDNAYGSSGEHLFGTQDLELLFNVFKKSFDQLKSGNLPTYEIQGKATELVAVDKDRLRVSLEKTLVNTENLKKVYAEITARISNTLKIITHKQLLASTDLGTSFKFYSAATYQAMARLLAVIKPRLKEAKKMEKELTKMKATYEKLAVSLGKMQQSVMALAGVTYQTIQQRTVKNLFDSARAMTQIVTLRLTTITMYLKCLKDVRESIATINSVNAPSKDAFKKFSF